MDNEKKFKRLSFEIDYKDYCMYGDSKWFFNKWDSKYQATRGLDNCKKCGQARRRHLNSRCVINGSLQDHQYFDPGDFEYICQKIIMEKSNVRTHVSGTQATEKETLQNAEKQQPDGSLQEEIIPTIQHMSNKE